MGGAYARLKHSQFQFFPMVVFYLILHQAYNFSYASRKFSALTRPLRERMMSVTTVCDISSLS